MSIPPATPAAFTDQEFEQLAAWLMRRRQGLCEIIELEGFLTAIAIGPNTLSPLAWLPNVWGGRQPKFKDLEEMNRFVALLMGYYNEIVGLFEADAEIFEPTFYESKVGGVLIVDEWCAGFVKGMRMDAAAWKPLRRQRPDLLKPIELFGTRPGWKELEAGGEAPMHAEWSPKIASSVRAIHAFWLPHRPGPHANGTPRRH